MGLLYSLAYYTIQVYLLYFLCRITFNNCSLIGFDIDQTIISNISLAFSFVEYFATAFGHATMYRQTYQRSRRLLVLLYVNIFACFAAGIIAFIFLIINFLVNADSIIFQWVRILSPAKYIVSNISYRYTRS
jgi:hypothetical protein